MYPLSFSSTFISKYKHVLTFYLVAMVTIYLYFYDVDFAGVRSGFQQTNGRVGD